MMWFKLGSDMAAVVFRKSGYEKAALKSLELLLTKFLVQPFSVYGV